MWLRPRPGNLLQVFGIAAFKFYARHCRKNNLSNCTADQRLCFRYRHRLYSSLLYEKSKISSSQPASVSVQAAWFVSDLVGNPNCWFSHAQSHIRQQQYRPLNKKRLNDQQSVGGPGVVYIFHKCSTAYICALANSTQTNQSLKQEVFVPYVVMLIIEVC